MRALRAAAGLAAAIAALGATSLPTSSPRILQVGSVALTPCPGPAPGWCGSIRRALDPGLRDGPLIPIAFQWLPSGAARPRGTVVAVEGGPGYPSTGSLAEYRGTFGPLQRHWNLLLVDNRGTGGSGLIPCPRLDGYPLSARASGPAFDRLVGACGRALNHRYRALSPGHPLVHASDLFGTAYAVQDLRAVLQRLGLRRVDLYGDSYGSWFAQAFAARFPHVLRSVTLDSTYAIRHLDPYYASSGSSGRAAERPWTASASATPAVRRPREATAPRSAAWPSSWRGSGAPRCGERFPERGSGWRSARGTWWTCSRMPGPTRSCGAISTPRCAPP